MSVITATVLYENETFVGDCDKVISLNCNEFTGDTPKFGWLAREAAPDGDINGIKYSLTFSDPATGPNPHPDALKGVWIETLGGTGVLIDANANTGVTDTITACNTCCGESAAVTPQYNGTFPALTAQTLHTGTVVRADNGSFIAKERAELDYYGRVLSIVFASRSGANSTYNITYYTKPTAIAGDTVTQLT